jgi:hypothetical protein
VNTLVTCETIAAIVIHVRRIGDRPIRLSGHSDKPTTLCGRLADWDTLIPVSPAAVSCRRCRVVLGWPERIVEQ